MIYKLLRSRPPHGGRGLKYIVVGADRIATVSPPARGAWIEIIAADIVRSHSAVSPPARGAWIEILWLRNCQNSRTGRPPHGGRGLKYALPEVWRKDMASPPARGAWIEIMLS